MILTELMIQHALMTMTDEPIKKKKRKRTTQVKSIQHFVSGRWSRVCALAEVVCQFPTKNMQRRFQDK